MSGPQFANIQTYSRRPNKAGNYIEQIIEEALRGPTFSKHIEKPKKPRSLLEGDEHQPENFLKMHDEHVAARSVQVVTGHDQDGKPIIKTRAIRKDRHTMASIVMSYPIPCVAIVTDGQKAAYEEWVKANLDWLRCEYGTQLRVALEHTDEEHPHIHAWLLPDNDGADATMLHPGKVAKKEAEAQAVAAGIDDRREVVKIGNLALKARMRAWQDGYHEAVGEPLGLTRVGPKRQRLSNAQWKAVKAEAARVARRLKEVKKREAALDQREDAVKKRELGARVTKLELLEKTDELTQARKEVEAEKEAATAAKAAAERIEKEAEAKALEAAEAAAAAAALREAAERDRAAAEAARKAAAGDKSRAAAALVKADVLAAQVEQADVAVQAELKKASNLVRVIDAAVRGLSSLIESNGGGLLAQVMAEARRVLTSDVRVAITSLGEMLTYRRPDGDKSDATVLREEIKEAQRALSVPEREGRGGIEAHGPFAERDASPDPAKDEGKDQAVGGGPDGP